MLSVLSSPKFCCMVRIKHTSSFEPHLTMRLMHWKLDNEAHDFDEISQKC